MDLGMTKAREYLDSHNPGYVPITSDHILTRIGMKTEEEHSCFSLKGALGRPLSTLNFEPLDIKRDQTMPPPWTLHTADDATLVYRQ